MSIKIIADSGSDILTLDKADFISVPLKVSTAEREFVDDENGNREEMIEYLKTYKEKSGTACPSVGEWLEAFGDSEEIFCITLTSALSGSYNSACVARDRYLEKHPGRKVTVIDSLSAGPGEGILAEKLESLVLEGKSFEEISEIMKEYRSSTELVFMIKSLQNLASNGRVKPSMAVLASVLGICLVGTASDVGTLEPVKKVRGEKNSLREIYAYMMQRGYKGGKVMVNHCRNGQAANDFKKLITDVFPNADITIRETRLLCSFYAESGGVLVGFEKN